MKKIKILLIIVTLSFSSLYGCGQSKNKDKDQQAAKNKPLAINVKSLGDKLESLYQNNDYEGLKDFFNKWNLQSIPLELDKITNPTEKEIYKIFQTFYDFDSTFKERLFPKIEPIAKEYFNKKRDYIVVQPEIGYWVEPFPIEDKACLSNYIFCTNREKAISIKNFRPNLNFDNGLFYDSSYKEVFETFFNKSGTDKSELSKRIDFLEKIVPIKRSHWGRAAGIQSAFQVDYISLSSDFKEAIVFFRVLHEGGYSKMRKINGEWIVEELELTWIE